MKNDSHPWPPQPVTALIMSGVFQLQSQPQQPAKHAIRGSGVTGGRYSPSIAPCCQMMAHWIWYSSPSQRTKAKPQNRCPVPFRTVWGYFQAVEACIYYPFKLEIILTYELQYVKQTHASTEEGKRHSASVLSVGWPTVKEESAQSRRIYLTWSWCTSISRKHCLL